METLLEFLSLRDPNLRYVVLGSVLLTASSAVVGTFTFLQKKSLVGDAVAHAVLPGVCMAFLWAETKNPFLLIIGAFITGWLSLILIDGITRYSKLKEDTAIGLVLSVFFGVGILLLTYIQQNGNAAQSGLDSFLFGKAAALMPQDVQAFGILAVVLLLTVALLYKEFKILAFDKAYAKILGLPVRTLQLTLTTLTVLAVVVGIQAVGVVLMAAMLITPAAAARFWTDRLPIMLVLATIFGVSSGLAGAYVSYTAVSMPTGPWIVVVISSIAAISFFFAPKKGIAFRLYRQMNNRRMILEENILKTFYNLGEKDGNFRHHWSREALLNQRHFLPSRLSSGLRRLTRQGFLKKNAGEWELTQAGYRKGKRTVRLHRLWELYLTQYLRIAPDHVHEDAETIEHLITPELERRLEEKLDFPTLDPHQSQIPNR